MTEILSTSSTIPNTTSETFDHFDLPEALQKSLKNMNFVHPTPIQLAAIPAALEGKDILGSAQTGTGKTGAFGIPLIAKLLKSSRGSALVLTPTRELAMQVITMMEQLLGKHSPIKSALLIGGDPMPKQLQQLRQRPRLIVGTPGRINDHLSRGTLMLHDTNFLVLDETDRMLDMGFGIQLDAIAKFLPAQRQTLMFSATMPHNIMAIAKKYLVEPVRVSVGEANAPIAKIEQENIQTTEATKYDALLDQLEAREGSVIVFVKTKYSAERMAMRLRNDNHSADAIHGDLRQNKRERVIHAFRNRRHRIMVATDIAARGLDIPHIEHVINFDLPQCPEDYIHRVGRTGRAGATGAAVNLITPQDALKWRAIERLINPGAARETAPFGRGAAGGKKSGASRGKFNDRNRQPNDRSESRGGRGEGRPARGERFEGGADFRAPRGERSDARPARPAREFSERNERGESRGGRGEGRPARGERFEGGADFRAPRGERSDARPARPAREFSERNDRSESRGGRGEGRPARGERFEGGADFRAPRGERSDARPARPAREFSERNERGESRGGRGEGRPARGESGFGARNGAGNRGGEQSAHGKNRSASGRPAGGKPTGGKRFGAGGKPASSSGRDQFGGNARPQRRKAS